MKVKRYLNVGFPDTDKVLVAYSGGKDSLAVVDLVVKAGFHVELYMMYFLPGLDYTQHWVQFAERHWGVKVHQYLHWSTVQHLRAGTFRHDVMDLKAVAIRDIEEKARRDTGIAWIGYGWRSQDGLSRRAWMHGWPKGICDNYDNRGQVFAPLKEWSSRMVKAYLARAKLPVPQMGGAERRVSGVNFNPESMAYMRDAWPADYERILKVFPLAAAQADRFALVDAWRKGQKTNAMKKAMATRAKNAILRKATE